MQTYNFLPGTIINTVDGGLTAAFTPTDDAVLVLATSGQGVANSPFQVTDLGAASQQFGFNGSLFKAVAEVSSYSDNVIAYRIGSSPAVLTGVGLDATVSATTPGFTITFGTVVANAAAIYQVWYAAGVLAVWNSGQIVFSNQTGAAVDTGDIRISNAAGLSGAAAITGNVGLVIGAGSSPLLTGASRLDVVPSFRRRENNPRAPSLASNANTQFRSSPSSFESDHHLAPMAVSFRPSRATLHALSDDLGPYRKTP